MPCGKYKYSLCGFNKRRSEGGMRLMGRLTYLNKVQQKPSPTRDYSSQTALERSIRRRTNVSLPDSKGNFGPLFGIKKNAVLDSDCNKSNTYINPNSGAGSDYTYWRKVYAGSLSLKPCSRYTPGCGDDDSDDDSDDLVTPTLATLN